MLQKVINSMRVLALFVTIFTFVMPVAASSTPAIWMVPEKNIFYTATTSVGDRFRLAFYIGAKNASYTEVSDLWAWQLMLSAGDNDPSIKMLKITGAWLNDTDPGGVFYGRATVNPTPVFQDVDGDGYIESVLIGDSLLIGPSFSGTGLLCTVELEITEAPSSALELDLEIDNANTYALDSALNTITLAKLDGYYRYELGSPPAPPVGGTWVPINKFDLVAPWIGLASLIAVATASTVYIKHKKKQQN